MSKQQRGFKPDPPEMAVMPFESFTSETLEELKPPTHLHGIRRGGSCHLYKSNDEYQIEISPDRSLKVYRISTGLR